MKRCLLPLSLLAIAACAPSSEGSAPVAVSATPAAIHEGLLTLDTHLDTPIHFARRGWSIADRHDYATDISQVDLLRMEEGGLDGGFFVIYTHQGDLTPAGYAKARAGAERRQQDILEMVAANRGSFELALTADDAERIAASGKRFVFQSIENSWPLGEDIGAMQGFYDRGVRMAGPVHSRDNQFGDSATGEGRWGGLSPAGRQWVAEMNRLGIVVDGSHSSDAAIDQLIALSATPIILSHSGPRALNGHARNLDDDGIRSVARSGGAICVNSVFLAPRESTPERDALDERLEAINDMTPEEQRAITAELRDLDARAPQEASTFEMFMASLLHLIDVAGVDHVCMGADWDGGGGVEGMRDISGLPQISERLLAAGYSEDDLQKMWSGNVLRLLRQAEAHAASSRQ